MILAATGHRPDKLGGYGNKARDALFQTAIRSLEHLAPSYVISGMALGWDTAIAHAAIALNIPFEAAVPFIGQDSRWPSSSREIYAQLLEQADKYTVVSSGEYAAWKMQARNEYMVDSADQIIACWNGTTGGTDNCLKYARSKSKKIHNAYNLFTRLIKE